MIDFKNSNFNLQNQSKQNYILHEGPVYSLGRWLFIILTGAAVLSWHHIHGPGHGINALFICHMTDVRSKIHKQLFFKILYNADSARIFLKSVIGPKYK